MFLAELMLCAFNKYVYVQPADFVCPFFLQSDEKMNEVMNLAHTFLQNFCRGNPQNQVLLHKSLNLFLTPGVSILFEVEYDNWNLIWVC